MEIGKTCFLLSNMQFTITLGANKKIPFIKVGICVLNVIAMNKYKRTGIECIVNFFINSL